MKPDSQKNRFSEINLPEIENSVKTVLDKIRPYLRIDGGDIHLVKVTTDGFVELRLTGSCSTCPLKPMTLRAGIERAIMHEIPQIKRIESIS